MSRRAWRQPSKTLAVGTPHRATRSLLRLLTAAVAACAPLSGCARWGWSGPSTSQSAPSATAPQDASNPAPAADASGGKSPDDPVEQLAGEIQQYVNRLPLDDVQAKLARYSQPDQASPPTYIVPAEPAESAADESAEPAPNRLVAPVPEPQPGAEPARPAQPPTPVQPAAATGTTTPPQATRIIEVDIVPAAQMTPPRKPTFPSMPEPTTNRPALNEAGGSASSRELRELLERFRKEALNRPDSVGAALRLRLAQWLLSDQDPTPEDWPLKDADKRELAEATWRVLQTVARAEATDPAASREDLAQAADVLAETLEKLQPLRIPFAALCRSVSSFGCFEALPEPVRFPAGRTHLVVLYYELAGFRSERSDEKPGW